MTHNYLELCDYGFPSKPRIDLFVKKTKNILLADTLRDVQILILTKSFQV
jgi:hypothetical protein